MPYYVIYVGGERRDRPNTKQDVANIERVLSLMDTSKCYTKLYDGERYIGQAEHVLPVLVAISYIGSLEDVELVKERLYNAGVTACAVATCSDPECTDIVEFEEVVWS